MYLIYTEAAEEPIITKRTLTVVCWCAKHVLVGSREVFKSYT